MEGIEEAVNGLEHLRLPPFCATGAAQLPRCRVLPQAEEQRDVGRPIGQRGRGWWRGGGNCGKGCLLHAPEGWLGLLGWRLTQHQQMPM